MLSFLCSSLKLKNRERLGTEDAPSQTERWATDTEEHREIRLQRMCTSQSEKLAAETEEHRDHTKYDAHEGMKVRDWPLTLKNRERERERERERQR